MSVSLLFTCSVDGCLSRVDAEFATVYEIDAPNGDSLNVDAVAAVPPGWIVEGNAYGFSTPVVRCPSHAK